ncbi:hypothetical protein [Streptomyces finlayi]|nr:hypothetical protein [Streptomyces finlayi]
MKYSKAAAVVAGSVMVLGAASPAFADDVDNRPAGSAKDSAKVVDTKVVALNKIYKPNTDVDAVTNLAGGVTEKATATHKATSNAVVGGADQTARSVPMMGGMPLGG